MALLVDKKLSMSSYSGASFLGIAGICGIIFWSCALAYGGFVGPEVPLHVLWVPSQWFHVLSAAFGVYGTIWIGRHSNEATLRTSVLCNQLGIIGIYLTILGQMCFFTDGVIALVVFPPFAETYPDTTKVTGILFTGSNGVAYVVFCVSYMIGHLVLGTALLWARDKSYPVPVVALMMIGAVFANLPPYVPFGLIGCGGLLWGIAASVLAIIHLVRLRQEFQDISSILGSGAPDIVNDKLDQQP